MSPGLAKIIYYLLLFSVGSSIGWAVNWISRKRRLNKPVIGLVFMIPPLVFEFHLYSQLLEGLAKLSPFDQGYLTGYYFGSAVIAFVIAFVFTFMDSRSHYKARTEAYSRSNTDEDEDRRCNQESA